jgi:glutamate racemase
MKIGFFDSGLGGLLIMKAVAKALPDFDYEFYGDTANLPYGNKSEEEIYALTKAGVEYLFVKDCALVIIACNTSSSTTLRRLQDGFLLEEHPDRKILGVIIPTIEEVVKSQLSNVLLIGTKRTIESDKYKLELEKFKAGHILTSVATPELVPLIEMGLIDDAYNQVLATVARVGEVDGLILGCTHYSLLGKKLKDNFGGKVTVFSQDEIIPSKLEKYLDAHVEIKSKLSNTGKRNIFLTDNSSRYDSFIQELLGGTFIGD